MIKPPSCSPLIRISHEAFERFVILKINRLNPKSLHLFLESFPWVCIHIKIDNISSFEKPTISFRARKTFYLILVQLAVVKSLVISIYLLYRKRESVALVRPHFRLSYLFLCSFAGGFKNGPINYIPDDGLLSYLITLHSDS